MSKFELLGVVLAKDLLSFFKLLKKLRREVWTVRLPKFVVHTSTKI